MDKASRIPGALCTLISIFYKGFTALTSGCDLHWDCPESDTWSRSRTVPTISPARALEREKRRPEGRRFPWNGGGLAPEAQA
jgi:hypothetical protein